MDFDIKITWPEDGETIELKLTSEKLEKKGQHGESTILVTDTGIKWILKIFNNVFDHEMHEIPFLDIDLEKSPQEMKERLQFWRAINEYTASNLGGELELNIPETLLVTSSKISLQKLEPEEILSLAPDEIILDQDSGAPETADEFYLLSLRENYTIETSEAFETLLKSHSLVNDPTTVIGVLTELIPNTKSLEQYMDESVFDKVVDNISKLDNAYKLIPFDTWLNDPDRNQGNYLIQFGKNEDEITDIYGIDYEMWSFSDDILNLVDITKGRSYLTAVIHKTTSFFDPRILETFFKISSLQDESIELLSMAPKLLCQFLEYHISVNNIGFDERIKLMQIEQNIRDFLFESMPKIDKLTIRLINQVGLPEEYKELETKILSIDEEEFFQPDYHSYINYDDEDGDDEEFDDDIEVDGDFDGQDDNEV